MFLKKEIKWSYYSNMLSLWILLMLWPCSVSIAGYSSTEYVMKEDKIEKVMSDNRDITSQYAQDVMSELLIYWDPPNDVNGVAEVTLTLSSEGRVLACMPLQYSNNPKFDESPCVAALKVEKFKTPPYGRVTKVHLTLATNSCSLTKEQENIKPYATRVMKAIRPYVEVPQGVQGSYTVIVELLIDKQGQIYSLILKESSGNNIIDTAVLDAVRMSEVLPIPEEKDRGPLRLSFTLIGK